MSLSPKLHYKNLADQEWVARLAVHFQAVAEKFSPHDTVFSFHAGSELVDNALSAACSLHTAPASIKSSNSLRQTGLAGISEDVGESQPTTGPESSTEKENGKLDAQDDTTSSKRKPNIVTPPPVREDSSPAPSSRTVRVTDKALPPTPDSPSNDGRSRQSLDHDEYQVRPSYEGRQSSQSTRPSTREGYDVYGYRPKIKVGPRPSLESYTGFSSSDPATRIYDPRPVSTLPASVRMPARKALSSKNIPRQRDKIPTLQRSPEPKPSSALMTKSSRSSMSSSPTVVPDPPISKPITKAVRSPSSDAKTSTMTPEKKRLMKALELRQKQLAAQRKAQDLESKEMTTYPDNIKVAKASQDEDLLRSTMNASEAINSPIGFQCELGDEDSGIVHLATRELVGTNNSNVDASPISGPEASDGPSTQASSISDEELPCLVHEIANDHNMPTSRDKIPIEATRISDSALCDTEEGTSSPNEEDSSTAVIAKNLNPEIISQPGSMSCRKEIIIGEEPELAEGASYVYLVEGKDDGNPPILPAMNATGRLSSNSEASPSPREKTLLNMASVASAPNDHQLQESQYRSAPPDISESETSIIHQALSPSGREDEPMCLAPIRASATSLQEEQLLIPREGLKESSQDATGHPNENGGHSILIQVSGEVRPPSEGSLAENRGPRQNRRHGLVEPVRRLSGGEISDDQSLSDDSLMEELQSATVQEAKPISVSKSPITSVFPRPSSEQRPESKSGRSASTPLQNSSTIGLNLVPEQSTLLSPRSVSASKPRSATPPQLSPPMLGKVGVSSGISQRIKALEKLSSRPTSPSASLSSPANATSAFATLGSRKSSLKSRPGTSDRPQSRQNKLSSSPILSPTASFEVTHPKPYNQFVSVNVASKTGKLRPDSISVTARIVRDARNKTPEVPRDASEPHVMDLHHSPLKVEHKSADALSPFPKKPTTKRQNTAPSVCSTSTDHRSETLSNSRHDSIASGSNSSRRGSETDLPCSVSEISLSGLSGDGTKEEKKESRKSRLLKRMSNSMAASRRSIATALSPPPVREESIAEHQECLPEAPLPSVEIGELNIQFPDTLVSSERLSGDHTNQLNQLWKRRQVTIDAQGILVLSPSKADGNSRVVTKRFPLLEFHSPYIPDQDRQEMPNSVNLDFKDGSTLQCACENLSRQAHVLGALTQAHHLYNNK